MTALGAVIEDLVKANNAVDIYEEYFAGKVLIPMLHLLSRMISDTNVFSCSPWVKTTC